MKLPETTAGRVEVIAYMLEQKLLTREQLMELFEVVPKEVRESPLWKALREDDETI